MIPFKDSDILLCKSAGLVPALIRWNTGSPYSHVAVIASAERLRLVQLAALKVMKKKEGADRLQEDQDYFCSELTYSAFLHAGVDIVPQIGDAETTSPGDIARSPRLEKISV